MSRSTQLLIAVGASVLVIVVISVVVAMIAGDEQDFPAGSPERAVQRYLRAIEDRDTDAAIALFSDDLTARCDLEPLRTNLRQGYNTDFRATLLDTTDRGDTTEVRVRLTEYYGDDPFNRGESRRDQLFVLEQSAEGWRFTEPPWPSSCPPARELPAPARPVTPATR